MVLKMSVCDCIYDNPHAKNGSGEFENCFSKEHSIQVKALIIDS